MSGLNKVMLIGNLGRDPEIRTTDSGVKVANFSIATTESYKDKDGEKVDKTEWHNLVLWRGLAELAEQFLRKGSKAYFEGKLATRSWEDADGNKRYTTEIIVSNMQFLSMSDVSSNDDGPTDEEALKNKPKGGKPPFNKNKAKGTYRKR